MKKTKYSSDYRIRWWLSLHILCLLPDETIGNNIDKVTENSATTSADAATKAEAKTDTKADAEVGGVVESEEAVVGISDLSEADDAKLYGAIFGTVVQDKDVLLDYDVLVDGEKVGSAPVFTGKNVRIQLAALKEMLMPFLDSDDIDPLDAKMDKEGFVSFKDLTQMSFKARINRLTMCVEISLPIEKKKIRSLSPFSRHREIPNAFPANISGLCNIRASKTFYKEAKSYNSTNLVLSPALNFWGLCIEGQTFYMKTLDSKEKGKFKRDYTRAVYDFPDHDIMIQYGDVFSRSLSYQSVPHVWGFNFNKGVERISREGWDRNIQITLLKKSTIEIYSNGHLIRTKNDVAPGTYVLDDVSFHNGDNDIKVKIIDETGREEILDESCFYESSYVPKGEFTLNTTYGYPQVNHRVNGRYDKKHPVFSGSVRYGLLSALEVGFGVLKNNIGHTTAYEIKHRNLLGSFNFKLANSLYKTNATNIKGKVFFASYTTQSIKLGEISTGFSTSCERSDNFFKPYLADTEDNLSRPSDFIKTEKNEKGKNTSISYGMWLDNVLSLNFHFTGSMKKRYDGAKSRNYSINVSKSFNWQGDWFNSGNISVSFERERDYDGVYRKSFSLYCSLFLENKVCVSTGMSKNQRYKKQIRDNVILS